MNKIIISLSTLAVIACSSPKKAANNNTISKKVIPLVEKYANTITKAELKTNLYTISSDEFEGRNTGEPGQKKVAEFLKNEYISMNIPSAFGTNNYFQNIPVKFFQGKSKHDSENVLAYIKGTEKPNELLVISAHMDHLGIKNGEVFNGADDNGTGTVALLEIAEAFKQAKKEGNGPKRSILFLHVTGEEKGLFGSRYYAKNPVFKLKNTIANINVDMIGRSDTIHKEDKNYIYVIGADRLSTGLDSVVTKANTRLNNFKLDYKYNDRNDPERIYYRSDHYNFAKNGVPAVFFFSGIHKDYHKHTDTAEKIDYDLLKTRSKLIFYTAWELVNKPNRILVDRDGK